MANSYKLTPKNITQKQIDKLIDIIHAANPVITDSLKTHTPLQLENGKTGVLTAVFRKHHRKLHQAMVQFDDVIPIG